MKLSVNIHLKNNVKKKKSLTVSDSNMRSRGNARTPVREGSVIAFKAACKSTDAASSRSEPSVCIIIHLKLTTRKPA